MIYINIFIPIYFKNNDGVKMELTEKILKHYINIKKRFEHKCVFKFIIIGSNGDISKNLVLKYFNDDEYYEFDQNKEVYNGDVLSMTKEKIKYGNCISYEKTPCDILLTAGSNDYICFDYVEQLINFYKPNERQMYGFGNNMNGNNMVIVCNYEFIKNGPTLVNNVWWDGYYDKLIVDSDSLIYCSGLIGCNYECLHNNIHILENITHDEIEMERIIKSDKSVKIFTCQNCFYMNIKIEGFDITGFSKCYVYALNNYTRYNFNDFDNKFKNMFNDEYIYFINI